MSDTLTIFDDFDILYNNIMSNSAPGLDNIEKAFFLNKAQDELIKNYFNPKGNKYQEGVDDSPKRQINFSKLIETCKLEKSTIISEFLGGICFILPEELFLILNEYVSSGNSRYTVLALTHSDYDIQTLKPYKYPKRNSAWRIFKSESGTSDRVSEIVLPYGVSDADLTYTIRYVKKPNSITENSTRDDFDDTMYQEILQRAVELAKAAYVGDFNSILEMGKRSE